MLFSGNNSSALANTFVILNNTVVKTTDVEGRSAVKLKGHSSYGIRSNELNSVE